MVRFFLLFYLLGFSTVKAGNNIDSLNLVFNSLSEPYSERHRAAKTIINYHLDLESNCPMEIVEKFVSQSEKEGNKKDIIEAYQSFGKVANRNSFELKSLEYLQLSLEYASELAYPALMSTSHNLLGIAYLGMSNYGDALDHLHQAITLAKSVKDTIQTLNSLRILAGLYHRLGKHDFAILYGQRFFDLAERSKDQKQIALGHLALGMVFIQFDRNEEAIQNILKAIPYFESQGMLFRQIVALNSLGMAYREQGDMDLALFYGRESNRILSSLKEPFVIPGIFLSLGETYLENNEADSAYSYLQKEWTLARQSDDLTWKLGTSKLLYGYHKKVNENELALHFNELTIQFRDSIDHIAFEEGLSFNQLKFELDEQRVSDSIRYQKIAKEKFTEGVRNKGEDFLQKGLIIGSLFLVLFGGGFYVFKKVRGRNEKTKVTSNPGQGIAETHPEIGSGINRIVVQEAIDFNLNETDWAILDALYENLGLTNKELAEEVGLGFEGVRSSLKKMYRDFQVEGSKHKLKSILIDKVKRISESSNNCQA